jgi:uncharacterized membrane protein
MGAHMRIEHGGEIRLTSCLLGMIGVVWAAIIVFDDPRISAITNRFNEDALQVFAIVMAIQGVMLCAGALLPWRKLRQLGLILGAISWCTLFGMYLDFWVLTFNTLMVGLLGFFTFVVLLLDVRRKPRADACAN